MNEKSLILVVENQKKPSQLIEIAVKDLLSHELITAEKANQVYAEVDIASIQHNVHDISTSGYDELDLADTGSGCLFCAKLGKN